MDPNETLKDLREHAKGCRETCRDDHCMNYADMIEELDEWLTKGGFLPEDWRGYADERYTQGQDDERSLRNETW